MLCSSLRISGHFRPYGIPSCITHRPLPIYQISFKSKKLFVVGRTDVRTDGHFSPSLILLGRLLEVDLIKWLQCRYLCKNVYQLCNVQDAVILHCTAENIVERADNRYLQASTWSHWNQTLIKSINHICTIIRIINRHVSGLHGAHAATPLAGASGCSVFYFVHRWNWLPCNLCFCSQPNFS